MIDRALYERKKTLQRARNALRKLKGAETLEADCLPELDGIFGRLRELGFCSNDRPPDNALPCGSSDTDIAEWISICINAETGAEYYLLYENIAFKIRISEPSAAVMSLWSAYGNCKGFTLVSIDKTKVYDLGCDSRDENNYLFDKYLL